MIGQVCEICGEIVDFLYETEEGSICRDCLNDLETEKEQK